MALTRLATLTGQVVDPKGKPIEGLTVALPSKSELANPSAPKDYLSSTTGVHVVTDSDGRFLASVSRGSYVLALGPKELSDTEPFLPYSEAAFEVVDQDIEPSFWPGGLPDPDRVIPVNVPGGASANMGTITAEFTSYHRVHIVSDHECEPDEVWMSRLVRGDQNVNPVRYTDCRQEFLLTGIPPGDYKFTVWVGRDVKRWAIAEFTITDRNTEASLHFSEPVQISGRLRTTGGSTLADLGSVVIRLRSLDGPSGALGKADKDGSIGSLMFPGSPSELPSNPINPVPTSSKSSTTAYP